MRRILGQVVMFSVVLFMVLLAPLRALASFPDVPQNHENVWSIRYLQLQGIMKGYPDGTFQPQGFINRAELITILVRLARHTPSVAQHHDCFPDVRSEWYAPFVCFAKSVGWVGGRPDGSFHPADPVNLAEATKMLVTSQGWPLEWPDPNWFEQHQIPIDGWYIRYIFTAGEHDVAPLPMWGNMLDTGLTPIKLAQSARRHIVASMLYRTLVANGRVSFPVSNPRQCSLKDIQTIEITHGEDTGGVQAVYLLGTNGSRCLLTTDLNPFLGVSSTTDDMCQHCVSVGSAVQCAPEECPHNGWYQTRTLIPINRTADFERGSDFTPVIGDKVYFIVCGDTSCVNPPGEHIWSLDLAELLLQELVVFPFSPVQIFLSPESRFAVGYSDQEIIVVDLPTARTCALSHLDSSMTLLSSSGAEGISPEGLVKFVLPSILSYEVFKERPHVEGPATGYEHLFTETVDILNHCNW